MADYTKHDQTTTRRIYSLPTPTNWAQVKKVLSALTEDEDRQRLGGWDHDVRVEAWGDEIRFSFEVVES